MKGLVSLSKRATILAALTLIATLLGSWWLSRQASTAQRIVPHDAATAQLLGDIGTPVGGIQDYIVFDERAFIERDEATEVRLLNETYLQDNGIYPWQLKTVYFVRTILLVIGTLAFTVFTLLTWFLASRLKKST